VTATRSITYEIVETVEGELYLQLDDIQRRAMEEVNQATAVYHVYTTEELEVICTNPRVVKVLALEGSRLLGMCALTNDLDVLLQFNVDFLRGQYTDLAEQDGIWYAVMGVVDPDEVGRRIFNALGLQMAEILHERRARVVMWDAVDANFDKISRWFEWLSWQRFGASGTQRVIDQHRWVAMELAPVPERVIDLRGE
jgi:hypothetical protein